MQTREQSEASRRAHSLGRRRLLESGAAMALVACTGAPSSVIFPARADDADARDAKGWLGQALTIDMHSHAGRVILSRTAAGGANRPFVDVAGQMRDGGMNVICLAIVADTPATRVSGDRRRIEPYRTPEQGELYMHAQAAFARAQDLIERQNLNVVTDVAGLRAARAHGPSVIISSEGSDFLEGQIDRVDEAYRVHRLRHLQLTHYRVNELGDIQTEPAQRGGLSDFGAQVIQRCNSLGMVVDVAHGTLDLVKRAAQISTKPLVLSHTSLAERPGPRSRQISPEHARIIAGTGGVIGVWPNSFNFANLDAMAAGARLMANAVGVDHVGLGTDMLGFISPPVFDNYRQLPAYAEALVGAGFTRGDVAKILGLNYMRVFGACMANGT